MVCATRGEAGQIRDATTAVRRTLGRVREGELRQACAHLGVSDVTMLDYGDGALDAVDPDALADHVGRLLVEGDPDVIVTFADDGAYGHPDHIAISNATTAAAIRLRRTTWSSRPIPVQLLRSHFPSSRISLAERLADWLVSMDRPFGGSADYGRALTLFAAEAATMRFASDDVRIVWYPSGSLIVEQDEPATSLLLILSGTVDVAKEGADGALHHLQSLGEGQFFGELGVAGRRARSASVIANGNVTCLELSTTERTKFDGRGATAGRPHEAEPPASRARARASPASYRSTSRPTSTTSWPRSPRTARSTRSTSTPSRDRCSRRCTARSTSSSCPPKAEDAVGPREHGGATRWSSGPDPVRSRTVVGMTPEEIADLAHLRRARDLMDRDYAQPLDVPAMARAALMSPAHFSRKFRAAYGETPYSYLMTRRIERAKALLRQGMSVTDTCVAVGCTSLGSFSSRFTEIVGETPSQYRARDHRDLEVVPSCVSMVATRPRRTTV